MFVGCFCGCQSYSCLWFWIMSNNTWCARSGRKDGSRAGQLLLESPWLPQFSASNIYMIIYLFFACLLLRRYHSRFSLSRFPRYLSRLKSQSNGISRIRQSGSAWTKWSLHAWMACEEHHLLVVSKFKGKNWSQKHINTVLASEANDGIWAQRTDLFLLWQEAAKDKAFRVSLSKTFDPQDIFFNFLKGQKQLRMQIWCSTDKRHCFLTQLIVQNKYVVAEWRNSSLATIPNEFSNLDILFSQVIPWIHSKPLPFPGSYW